MSVTEQLERILKSATLVSSPSLSRFLRYVVEETLAGRGEAIREYTLGVHVFDRGTDFNPRLDPIVRVQARNLRARIAKYYECQGAADPVCIELPKGRYVPIFHVRESVDEAPAPATELALDSSPAPAPAPVVEPPPVPVPVSTVSAPPPHSNAATPRGMERYLITMVVLLAILVGMAALLLTQLHATGARMPGKMVQDVYLRGRAAVQHAPNYAAAHAGLADAYNALAQLGLSSPADAMEKASSEAQRAIALALRMAEGPVALAAVLEAYDWKRSASTARRCN